MLSILGAQAGRFCDGVSRRDFLKLGGLALGGLSLPQLLQAEAAAGVSGSHKAVIMVFLAGGPSHQDMFDLKPGCAIRNPGRIQAHSNRRSGPGNLRAHAPPARMMSKFVVVRTLIGAGGEHSAGQCLTGYRDLISKAQGGRPSLGAIVSQLKGPVQRDIPPFVGLSPRTSHAPWGDPGDPGYLGLARAPFTPFRTSEGGSAGGPMKSGSGSASLGLDEPSIAPGRLDGRHSLLSQARRDAPGPRSFRGDEGDG